jgi:hypothetical protein
LLYVGFHAFQQPDEGEIENAVTKRLVAQGGKTIGADDWKKRRHLAEQVEILADYAGS